MPVNSTHAEYDEMMPKWLRARDVLGGEDMVKAGREKYLPRLQGQSDEEFDAYLRRTSFYNATARTLAGYVGLVFRKAPYVRLPGGGGALEAAMAQFSNDMDMLGTSLYGYAKQVLGEVVSVGRCGTLVDWEADVEDRVYATVYRTEDILNWRVERVNGRNVCTLVVLYEAGTGVATGEDDFLSEVGAQIRVLRLVAVNNNEGGREYECHVEIWRQEEKSEGKVQGEEAWVLAERAVPLRAGKPLPLIPFVFHGPDSSRPGAGRLMLEDIICMNLAHYRLDADYKHGLHYTALPTAWVSGFEKSAVLKIGSSVAWVTETPGATAGFLEFHGQGLGAFEKALDRSERLMAILGSRLLEGQKRVTESAEAMMIRQSGEESILSSIATSISESLTQVLRWAYWWNSTEKYPEDVDDQSALIDLNTDFRAIGMSSQEVTATVGAWQAGAISQDTMFELFRRSEILPDGRKNDEERALIKSGVETGTLKVVEAGGETEKE